MIKKKDFKIFINGHIEKEDLARSLQFLSLLLNALHSEEVYIFIDEYDALLNATYDTE